MGAETLEKEKKRMASEVANLAAIKKKKHSCNQEELRGTPGEFARTFRSRS
jgi:hypothetical protein